MGGKRDMKVWAQIIIIILLVIIALIIVQTQRYKHLGHGRMFDTLTGKAFIIKIKQENLEAIKKKLRRKGALSFEERFRELEKMYEGR